MMRRRFRKFELVGFLGAIVQLSTLALLTKYGLAPLVPATLISVELAIVHNFLWHERYTWQDRKTLDAFTRLLRFHLANGLVSVVGNILLAFLLVTQLHLPPMPSALAAILLCSFANFALIDRWVYRRIF